MSSPVVRTRLVDSRAEGAQYIPVILSTVRLYERNHSGKIGISGAYGMRPSSLNRKYSSMKLRAKMHN